MVYHFQSKCYRSVEWKPFIAFLLNFLSHGSHYKYLLGFDNECHYMPPLLLSTLCTVHLLGVHLTNASCVTILVNEASGLKMIP